MLTLIDITETKARKGDDFYKQKQQQNYLTAYQTMSMRANPTINKSPVVKEIAVKDFDFGSDFKGKQKAWELEFEFESEGQHSLDFLKNDFDLVPVISDLDESVTLKIQAFMTNGSSQRNTLFFKE